MHTVMVTVVWGLPFPPPIIFFVIMTKGGRLSVASVWAEGLPTVDRKTTMTRAVLEFVHAELAGVLTTATSHLHTKEFADGRAHKAVACLCTQFITTVLYPTAHSGSTNHWFKE